MRRKLKPIIFYLTLIIMTLSCNRRPVEPTEKNTDLLITKTDTMNFTEMKAELKKQYKTAVAKMDEEIRVLEAKIESTSEKGKAELDKSLSEMKKQRNELQAKMDEIEKASESTLDEWKNKADVFLEKAENKADSLKQSIKDTVAAW